MDASVVGILVSGVTGVKLVTSIAPVETVAGRMVRIGGLLK